MALCTLYNFISPIHPSNNTYMTLFSLPLTLLLKVTSYLRVANSNRNFSIFNLRGPLTVCSTWQDHCYYGSLPSWTPWPDSFSFSSYVTISSRSVSDVDLTKCHPGVPLTLYYLHLRLRLSFFFFFFLIALDSIPALPHCRSISPCQICPLGLNPGSWSLDSCIHLPIWHLLDT